MKRQE